MPDHHDRQIDAQRRQQLAAQLSDFITAYHRWTASKLPRKDLTRARIRVLYVLGCLGPISMGALGKKQRQGGLNPSDLGGLLQQEQRSAARQAPDLGMLGSLLDADGDGDIKDDVAKIGGSLLKSFFNKRR